LTFRTTRSTRARIGALFFAAGALAAGLPVHALDEGDRVMVQAAPDALHYSNSPEHTKYAWLIGAEYLRKDRWLAGYSYFNNSFGQKSHYIYGGYTWKLSGEEASYWYAKLTAGVILGYKEPYEDKIPFNHNGVAPGIIPAIGYQYERFNLQLNVLGTAGLMLTFGYDLLR